MNSGSKLTITRARTFCLISTNVFFIKLESILNCGSSKWWISPNSSPENTYGMWHIIFMVLAVYTRIDIERSKHYKITRINCIRNSHWLFNLIDNKLKISLISGFKLLFWSTRIIYWAKRNVYNNWSRLFSVIEMNIF